MMADSFVSGIDAACKVIALIAALRAIHVGFKGERWSEAAFFMAFAAFMAT